MAEGKRPRVRWPGKSTAFGAEPRDPRVSPSLSLFGHSRSGLAVVSLGLVGAVEQPRPAAGVLQVEVDRRGPDGFVVLSGEFDQSCTKVFADAVSQLVGADPVARIEVRADGLGFIDSLGLTTLLTARRSLEALGIEFRLTSVSPAMRRIIEISEIPELLPES